MNRSDYQVYLASRPWALLREQVRARSGGRCERCRRAPYEETHHVTYERVGQERLEDLLGVCAPCHRFLSAKSHADPARCAVFLAGPVPETPMTDWQDVYVSLLPRVDIIVPVREGLDNHGMWIAAALEEPEQVVNSNIGAMQSCCAVFGFLDHGNRVGTVVDLMCALAMRKRVILFDRSPMGERVGGCGHGLTCNCTPMSEAWYLAATIHRAGGVVFHRGEEEASEAASVLNHWIRTCAVPHMPEQHWDAFGSVRRFSVADAVVS